MAADRVGPRGRIVGVDISLPMLRIAQAKVASNAISWMAMDGQALALRGGSFDAVTCQLGLMFFPDPRRGLAECRRVLRPSGRVGLAVLSRPEGFPYGVVFEALAERVASERNALLLGFSLGDGNALKMLLKSAGFHDVRVSYERAQVLFDSFEEYWAPLESGGGRAGQVYVGLAADVRGNVLQEVRDRMARFERGRPLALETETLFGSRWRSDGVAARGVGTVHPYCTIETLGSADNDHDVRRDGPECLRAVHGAMEPAARAVIRWVRRRSNR